MDIRPEVFADGMGEITLTGGMVRVDFVALSATKKNSEGRPELEIRQRVVMPPDGFLRSFSAMEDLMKKLIEAGVVKQRQQDIVAEAPKESAPAKKSKAAKK